MAWLVVGLTPAAPGAIAAEPAAPAQVSVQDLETLAATIEDEAKRKELLAQIRGLIEVARGAPQDEVETLGPRLVSTLSATAGEISDEIVAAANRLSNLPVLTAWIERQVTDPQVRSIWLLALLKLTAAIAVGWLAEKVAGLLLARPRRALWGARRQAWRCASRSCWPVPSWSSCRWPPSRWPPTRSCRS
jgi:hypothetical protein